MTKKILIITTINDGSLPLFFLNSKKNSPLNIEVLLFEDDEEAFILTSKKISSFDLVYIRDPFNSDLAKNWERKSNHIFQQIRDKNVRSVDGYNQLNCFDIQDKWIQYQQLSEFMMPTQIFQQKIQFDINKHFLKKRVSCRALGIVFDSAEISKPDDYIIQDKIEIIEEYRVLAVHNQIIPTAVFKKSKTQTSHIQVDRSRVKNIDSELHFYVIKILKKLDLDFVGFDIALTDKNEFKLIEISRSPQFKAFFETTGINPAELLFSGYF